MDLAAWAFDRSMGMPGPNGHFPAWLSWTFHGSHAVLAIVFFSVPLIVSSKWSYRRDGVTPRQYWGVMGLFLSIGGKSAVRVLEIWGPPYHLVAITDFLSAVIAVIAVPNIVSLLVHVLHLPSRQSVHDLADRLNVALLTARVERDDLAERNRNLLDALADFEHTLALEGWTHEKAIALAEIRGMLRASLPYEKSKDR